MSWKSVKLHLERVWNVCNVYKCTEKRVSHMYHSLQLLWTGENHTNSAKVCFIASLVLIECNFPYVLVICLLDLRPLYPIGFVLKSIHEQICAWKFVCCVSVHVIHHVHCTTVSLHTQCHDIRLFSECTTVCKSTSTCSMGAAALIRWVLSTWHLLWHDHLVFCNTCLSWHLQSCLFLFSLSDLVAKKDGQQSTELEVGILLRSKQASKALHCQTESYADRQPLAHTLRSSESCWLR